MTVQPLLPESPDEVAEIKAGLDSGELHPGETKRRLARAVVALYWGDQATEEAEAAFDRVFKEGGVPDEIDEVHLPREIGRCINEVVALGIWFNEGQRCHVARGRPRSGSAFRR